MNDIRSDLQAHPFLEGLPSHVADRLLACAGDVEFHDGQHLFLEGEPADRFYLLRDGLVALEMVVPGRGPVTLETLGPGEVVGWSWLVQPYRWHFGARVVVPTTAVAFDASCVRDLCERDPVLGRELTLRFLNVVVDRLQSTRLRLLDLYGHAYAG